MPFQELVGPLSPPLATQEFFVRRQVMDLSFEGYCIYERGNLMLLESRQMSLERGNSDVDECSFLDRPPSRASQAAPAGLLNTLEWFNERST